ncbi:hypothetical protein COB11_03810 [Candidatus Aerophobetes bacterium]|uniref:CHAT domain-containing protein n=1 Tax=Aerophobetes bacterium TaxID=2030807 RepID=A0A2A4YI21_UNCAE|nr:MAG: hypothetical protein COB11_03810 [Candidatus Aerophobetes bacterium]
MIKRISETHNIIVKQIKSSKDALEKLQEIKGNNKDTKITDVVFSMHGSPTSLQISEDSFGLDLDISSVIEEKDANIYLATCSTGKKPPSGISYAERLSQKHPTASIYAVDGRLLNMSIQFPFSKTKKPFVRCTVDTLHHSFQEPERVFAKIFRAGCEVSA